MKYLSLFSGIGGFELGIQQAYEDLQNLGQLQQKDTGQNGSIGLTESQYLEGSRVECIGYSEIDKYAIQVYNKHFNHKNYGDCTKIITSELPDFDLLVGGFPCQAFSIAGKRRGFDEARGTLFFDIARILADKKPRNFILENVKGLLSHDGGRTFTTIIRILSTMGYFVEWQVLNAKNFGVPQNRERVFIVGHLGGQPRRKVFPIGEKCEENIVLPTITTRITADSNGTYVRKRQTHQELCGYSSSQRTDHIEHRVKIGEANAMTTGKGCAGGMKSMSFVIEDFYPDRIRTFENISPTIRKGREGLKVLDTNLNKIVSYKYGKQSKLDDRTLEGEKKLRKENGDMFGLQKEKENGNTSSQRGLARQQGEELGGDMPQLPHEDAQEKTDVQSAGLQSDSQEIRILREAQPEVQEIRESVGVQKESAQPYRIRRLTPLEAERLMGYPDNWTAEGTQGKISDTQRYKMCGNGIVSNVVKEVVKKLL
jgi:DNA (cytosine-5)-methyltransferase 1